MLLNEHRCKREVAQRIGGLEWWRPDLSFPQRHQAEVQDQPDREGEESDGEQSFPGPRQIVGLDGVDGYHEIVGEPRVAEEGAILGIFASKAAEEGERAKGQDKE